MRLANQESRSRAPGQSGNRTLRNSRIENRKSREIVTINLRRSGSRRRREFLSGRSTARGRAGIRSRYRRDCRLRAKNINRHQCAIFLDHEFPPAQQFSAYPRRQGGSPSVGGWNTFPHAVQRPFAGHLDAGFVCRRVPSLQDRFFGESGVAESNSPIWRTGYRSA